MAPQPHKPAPLKWDRLAKDWWSSAVGYARREENGFWTAYVHRNVRVGKGWTESREGFVTADKARQWIEHEAED
jgi:hypothetical protein